ncbi:MAG: signal peptidase I [Lactobacillaceae bacterium]|jgi:signal peptidase I|nr:signal peptidase I [Lactobacillaceae bacterium]
MEKPNSVMDTIKTVIYAIVIAVLIRTLAFEPFKIPSSSMYPTLYIGDYLFVSKYTYGYSKHSLPLSIPLWEGRVWKGELKRGDVVVFKLPSDERIDFIKRVVALPGDKVKLIKGRLFINDKMIEREQIEDYVDRDDAGNPTRYKQYIEDLEGVKHNIFEISDNETFDDFEEITVPEGKFFAMGDNRDRSDDSRRIVGMVPMENIVGKARVLFFSHNNEGAWYKPWTWPRIIRWRRLFSIIK